MSIEEPRETMSLLPAFAKPIKKILESHSEEIVLCSLTMLIGWVCVWVIKITMRRFLSPPSSIDETQDVNVVPEEMEEKPVKPRFRKRDKVMFYGRKIMRKMGSVGATVGSAADNFNINSRTHRQIISEVFQRILRAENNRENRLEEKEVPSTMLEVDVTEAESVLPPDILYMLKSIKVFGHFERPLFLQLCKKMETVRLAAGQWLFRPGDPDDSIFVVQDGSMEIFIQKDNRDILAKVVQPGESVTSLLSILDVLTGHPEPFKTVSGRATRDSTILRLPGTAFKEVFKDSPQSLVRIVQVIMVRLQRVTFMALQHYLGLTTELINPHINLTQSVSGFGGHSTVHATDQPKNFCSQSPKTSPKRVKRSTSLPRSISVTTPSSSDFDAAASRARVNNSKASEPPTPLSTSAPGDRDESRVVPTAANTLPMQKRGPRKSSSRGEVQQVSPDYYSGNSYGGFYDNVNEKLILQRATRELVEIFGLHDPNLLKNKLAIGKYPAGYTIVHQGAQDSDLLYVLTGHLSVVQSRSRSASGRYAVPESVEIDNPSEENVLYHCHKGDLIDSLAVLTGEPSVFSVRADTNCILVQISKNNFYSIMRQQPTVVLSVAHTIVKRLSGFVRSIDFALDWIHIEAGKALFRQGDKPDSIFIVLNGRLRSVMQEQSPDDVAKKRLIGEYGRGEIVGLVETLMQTSRTTTVMAVRDTELAQMPQGLLDAIKQMYPQVVSRLVHLLGTRILGTLKGDTATQVPVSASAPPTTPKVTNLATVAIIAISDDVPIVAFAKELEKHLTLIGNTLRLNSDLVLSRLGATAMDTVNEYRLLSWLGMQEDIHRMVIYQCDNRMTPWSLRCIRQADCLLVVGLARHDPRKLGTVEKQLEGMSLRCQKELVLLYKQDSQRPARTADWLNARGYLLSHHHIRCPDYIFRDRKRSPIPPSKNWSQQSHVEEADAQPNRLSDFSRLARFLTGTGIGLVLGGGGARGMAHIGVIKAMQEYGIPIDMVGGTSIGSFVGALWAEERSPEAIADRAKRWCDVMGSLWQKVIDLTYPITSMFTGAGFNASIEGVFGDRQIEDLWIPYFAVTTDISSSQQRVHRSGSLWRYVRASMSLSGYLPPLCDPNDGHLLLDGGYVNNVPADVMKDLGCQTIIAVDVGSIDDQDLTNYGDSLSGWWLMFKRYCPGAKPVRVPDLNEIQSRLAYVSCVRLLETVKGSNWCQFIRPPIDRFKTLQFYSFDDIYQCGLHHGFTVCDAWKKGGFLNTIFLEKGPEKSEAKNKYNVETRERIAPMLRNSSDQMTATATYADLAELVSTIRKPETSSSEVSLFPEDDEDEMFDFGEEEEEDAAEFSEGREEVFGMEDSEFEDVSDPSDPPHGAVHFQSGVFPDNKSLNSASRQLATLKKGLIKDGGKMHLVLESENGERVSVPINPEEFDFTDEEDEEDDVVNSKTEAVVQGDLEGTLCPGDDDPGNVSASRSDRESTPTAALPIVIRARRSSGGEAGAAPEVGVATRMVNERSTSDDDGQAVRVENVLALSSLLDGSLPPRQPTDLS